MVEGEKPSGFESRDPLQRVEVEENTYAF